MTTANTRMVAERLVRLGRLVRWKASRSPLTLSARVARMWNRAMMAPSNSVPERGGEEERRGWGEEGRRGRAGDWKGGRGEEEGRQRGGGRES